MMMIWGYIMTFMNHESLMFMGNKNSKKQGHADT